MQFSEKQLVEAFWQDALMWDHNPLEFERGVNFRKRDRPIRRRYNLSAHREFSLPSGRRIDVLIQSKYQRFIWIIEFKVVVEASAILQLAEYYQEVKQHFIFNKGKRRRCRIGVSLAGQFFKDDALFFAEQLGIQCLHVTPTNYSKCSVQEINEPCLRRFSTKGYFNG